MIWSFLWHAQQAISHCECLHGFGDSACMWACMEEEIPFYLTTACLTVSVRSIIYNCHEYLISKGLCSCSHYSVTNSLGMLLRGIQTLVYYNRWFIVSSISLLVSSYSSFLYLTSLIFSPLLQHDCGRIWGWQVLSWSLADRPGQAVLIWGPWGVDNIRCHFGSNRLFNSSWWLCIYLLALVCFVCVSSFLFNITPHF